MLTIFVKFSQNFNNELIFCFLASGSIWLFTKYIFHAPEKDSYVCFAPFRGVMPHAHRCQPSRNRAGNPANLVVSRIPAFFPKHPAFLGFFGGEKNRRNSQ